MYVMNMILSVYLIYLFIYYYLCVLINGNYLYSLMAT